MLLKNPYQLNWSSFWEVAQEWVRLENDGSFFHIKFTSVWKCYNVSSAFNENPHYIPVSLLKAPFTIMLFSMASWYNIMGFFFKVRGCIFSMSSFILNWLNCFRVNSLMPSMWSSAPRRHGMSFVSWPSWMTWSANQATWSVCPAQVSSASLKHSKLVRKRRCCHCQRYTWAQ